MYNPYSFFPPCNLEKLNSVFSLNVEFFADSERTLPAYFQFAPDGFGSRCACIDSGAPHFNYFNRQKSSQTVNMPALLFFSQKTRHSGYLKDKEMSLRRQLKNSAVRKNVLTACGIIPHEEEVFRRTAEFFRLGRFCVFGLRNYSVRGISVFSPCGAVPQPEEASVRAAEFCMRPAICFFR